MAEKLIEIFLVRFQIFLQWCNPTPGPSPKEEGARAHFAIDISVVFASFDLLSGCLSEVLTVHAASNRCTRPLRD